LGLQKDTSITKPFATMKITALNICLIAALGACVFSYDARHRAKNSERIALAEKIQSSMERELLHVWYPRNVDHEYGGFLSTFTYDWKQAHNQDKMIVSQARHIWVNAKAAVLYPDTLHYLKSAAHGVKFLKSKMWDSVHGGFFTLVSREGKVLDSMKTAYGNSFAIFALSAYYAASKDSTALNLARKSFLWLEKFSHDPIHKGYFQHLNPDGSRVIRDASTDSRAETGYKDQNSSIHLLEALTELYQVCPDPLVKERLTEMLYLIRDTITSEKGSLILFFTPDWKPVTFRDSTREVIEKHKGLDHVSFGHDVETAYLMIEASHILGIENDTTTLRIAKRMVDHSLNTGWDKTVGGFYDGGYYFKDEEGITIIMKGKNWWTQAEGLNALLLMAEKFPDDPMDYYSKFKTLWDYIDTYVIDHQYGDWYAGGLDKEPFQKKALKGHIWKASYHQFRALSNCVAMLRNGETGHR
jgi:mannobiose 2-epimerase